MLHRLTLLAEPLLRRLRPAAGRHRRGVVLPDRPAVAGDPATVRIPAARQPVVLRGEEVALVRPYLLAHERQRYRRRMRQRALWEAMHCVEFGPVAA